MKGRWARIGPAACLGSNRRSVWLQTIGLTQIGGRFGFKPLIWPKSEVGFAPNHWFSPNRRSVWLQTIGLDGIGGRFGFKPLVWTKSEVGLAPNHWFRRNRRSVWLQTIGLDEIGSLFGLQPMCAAPNRAPRSTNDHCLPPHPSSLRTTRGDHLYAEGGAVSGLRGAHIDAPPRRCLHDAAHEREA